MEKIQNKKNGFNVIIAIIVGLILLDQVTKILVVKFLPSEGLNVIKNVLRFDYVENTGIAFGMGAGETVKIVIINLFALFIIGKFMWTQRERINKATMVAGGVVIAGGISNLIDRIFRRYVVDFINLIPKIYFPKFNLADTYIVCAWIFLAFVFAFNTWNEFKESKSEKIKKAEEIK